MRRMTPRQGRFFADSKEWDFPGANVVKYSIRDTSYCSRVRSVSRQVASLGARSCRTTGEVEDVARRERINERERRREVPDIN
jgi:hypothetical protein